jgi:protein tyrosine/serine phosphatase
MPRKLEWLLSALLVAVLIGGPLAFVNYRKANFRNFRVVESGVLYRSGQLSIPGLKRILNDYGIRTIVTLRDTYVPGKAPPDLAEENFCRDQELNYVRITPLGWWSPDGTVPAEEGVRKFLEVMDDPKNYPVHLHCFAGTHRSGAYVAIYRMEYQHWSNAEALAELKANGYINLDEEQDILGFLESYVPRWRRNAGEECE